MPAPSGSAPRSDLAERAFERASGAPLIPGNRVRVLFDAAENYPAWLKAIASARASILLESYIIDEDAVGRVFAEALAERARAGVRVRVIRDWLGSRAGASDEFWRALEEAGVELRVFNPPSLFSPLGWVSRDHRKLIAVDGRIGFVSGLCISTRWVGDPAGGLAPWRDTGVQLEGPAVAAIERAFEEVWRVAGPSLPGRASREPALPGAAPLEPAGGVPVRIIASQPTSTDLFRLDQLIAAAAERTLWLTDAYFVGFAPYVQALRGAARDGVDVRLLVPSTTDLPFVSRLSRAGYRPLLEAGVRVFEWDGPMIHAKTAVADGRWARVGSSNLNLASFIGNYELDVAIEDPATARVLEEAYLKDLSGSTEIVLRGKRRALPVAPRGPAPGVVRGKGLSGRPPVAVVRFATAVGAAAASGTRALGAVETGIERTLAAVLGLLAAVGILWPRALAYPLAALGGWLALVLLLRAERNARRLKAELELLPRDPAPPPADGPPSGAD